MIYSIYIYSRSGTCLYDEKFQVGKTINYSDPEEEKRLLYGLIFSLKEFVQKVTPSPAGSNESPNTNCQTSQDTLQRFQTNSYTCHHYETSTGLRLILFSDKSAGDLSSALKYIYSHLYVEYVVNNPLLEMKTNGAISSQLFHTQLKQYIEGLPCFK
jgi:hypothetical protein